MYRLLVCLALLGACHAAKEPELRVLGLHDAPARENAASVFSGRSADAPRWA